VALLACSWLAAGGPPAPGSDDGPTAPDPARVENPRDRAAVHGKYRTLLRRIAAPADRATYKYFCDYGWYSGTEWAGHRDLPPGYWVYVYPHWYVWRDGPGK
jgi:hypothetical protein